MKLFENCNHGGNTYFDLFVSIMQCNTKYYGGRNVLDTRSGVGALELLVM